jgi:phage gp36-like protein
MAAYADIAGLKLVGILPPEDIDALEAARSGVVESVCDRVSRLIDARLAKRYKTPFDPVPIAVRDCAEQLATVRLYRIRGAQPGTEIEQSIKDTQEAADAWLKEAADSKDGLIDLPVRDTDSADVSAIDRGGPMCESDLDAYAWMDADREARNG